MGDLHLETQVQICFEKGSILNCLNKLPWHEIKYIEKMIDNIKREHENRIQYNIKFLGQ
jgi:hypothetical protein